MTLADLIYRLRERLIDALDKHDQQVCRDLMTTFQMILDESYEFRNQELSGMLEDLVYSAQHGAMDVQFKARDAVPKDEMMKKVFPSHTE